MTLTNGSFDTKEWYSDLNESVVYRLVSGQVVDGFWDGNVVWAFDSNSQYQSWDCTFTQGVAVIVDSHTVDGVVYNIWSTTTREGGSTMLSSSADEENELEGIAGFIPE